MVICRKSKEYSDKNEIVGNAKIIFFKRKEELEKLLNDSSDR